MSYFSFRFLIYTNFSNTDEGSPPLTIPVACSVLCSNARGLFKNLCDLTVSSSQYDILWCSETLISDLSYISELLLYGCDHDIFICRDRLPRSGELAAYERDGFGAFRQPMFECGCFEILVFRVVVSVIFFYVLILYCNPDLDSRIYVFIFVGDLNGHYQEWLGSTIMNRHSNAAFDFGTVTGCDQQVIAQPMHVVVPKKFYW